MEQQHLDFFQLSVNTVILKFQLETELSLTVADYDKLKFVTFGPVGWQLGALI